VGVGGGGGGGGGGVWGFFGLGWGGEGRGGRLGGVWWGWWGGGGGGLMKKRSLSITSRETKKGTRSSKLNGKRPTERKEKNFSKEKSLIWGDKQREIKEGEVLSSKLRLIKG